MIKKLLISFVRIGLSLIFAGIFYFGWMAVAITAFKAGCCPVVKGLLWVLAPVVTAAGFAAGIVLIDLIVRAGKIRLFRVYLWPLAGCAIGAGVVFPFGPMLIVFGMFGLGTASVILREILPNTTLAKK